MKSQAEQALLKRMIVLAHLPFLCEALLFELEGFSTRIIVDFVRAHAVTYCLHRSSYNLISVPVPAAEREEF